MSTRLPVWTLIMDVDASVFYYLEAWIASPVDLSTTRYLEQMELFQRHLTTAAFKIAGGVDLSSTSLTKPTKQHPIPQAFVSKITKAFLDALYAFLDGLVLLASDESPIVVGTRPLAEAPPSVAPNPFELLDLTDGVLCSRLFNQCATYLFQDTRILVVISNFGYLSNAVIPSMLTQLEAALGTSILEDRQVLLCTHSQF